MRNDIDTIEVSGLGKTWIFDLDGTVVKHNGYLTDGKDTLLSGAKEFFGNIDDNDKVIFVTSRKAEYKEITETFLTNMGIRFDYILYEMPYGERILVNDKKESGLKTAIAINTERNVFMKDRIVVNDLL